MIRSMYTAASGMEAQQVFMDTISHNLSNTNTTGYKREKAEFQDLMYQTLKEPGVRNAEGSTAPSGIEVGLGVRLATTQRIFQQGSLNATTNPMDVAIEGDGFLQIQLPDGGTAYTRDGSLKRSADGSIVTSDGYYLEPHIVIPAEATGEPVIGKDGKVSVALNNDQTTTDIGQIELARFVNPAGLKALGGNLLVQTDASGEPIVENPGTAGMGQVLQGYVEASNVQIVEEMVSMITTQRAYEIVSKAIQTSEEMMQIANSLKR